MYEKGRPVEGCCDASALFNLYLCGMNQCREKAPASRRLQWWLHCSRDGLAIRFEAVHHASELISCGLTGVCRTTAEGACAGRAGITVMAALREKLWWCIRGEVGIRRHRTVGECVHAALSRQSRHVMRRLLIVQPRRVLQRGSWITAGLLPPWSGNGAAASGP